MAGENRNLKELARRTYEGARLRSAIMLSLPVLVIIGLAWLVDRETTPILVAGPILFATATYCFWRGQDVGRGVLPGIAAGALPFTAMHVARMSGHVCRGPLCWSLCLPATFAAAAVAGVVIAHRARRSGTPFAAWGSAGVVAALTGSLGCACIGLGGVAGLVAGIVVGALPIALQSSVRARS